MIPDAGPHSPPGSRSELIDQFLELQPRMRRRLTRVIPPYVHSEMDEVTFQQMHALHVIALRSGVTMGELAGCLEAASLSSATQMADRKTWQDLHPQQPQRSALHQAHAVSERIDSCEQVGALLEEQRADFGQGHLAGRPM